MRRFGIIGAGFCGTMTAVHLLNGLAARRERGEILLFERSAYFTAGLAYGTRCESHVLNVPAGRMSALPDDSDHFLRWMRQTDPKIGGGSFVPRQWYGRYLADTLTQAQARAHGVVTLERVPRAVYALEELDSGVRLILDDLSERRASHVVLAIGNFPPSDPPLDEPAFYQSPHYMRDPWSPAALDLGPEDRVLLLGTGLTMIDVALALHERGHQGAITAISRRGLLPQPHRVSIRPPAHYPRPADLDRWPRTARGLVRALRREVRSAERRGVNWREVVTALRADTPALWQSLPVVERRRFLRHVRPFWETHRHRAAPEAAAGVAELIARGALTVLAARATAYHETPAGIAAQLRLRGGAEQTLVVDRVINCTGPDTDLTRVAEPLIQALYKSRLIRPDALGLGLDTTPEGALLSATGRASARLSLLGPLRKGQLWENTAVPELRVEAARLAQHLLGEGS